MASNAAGMGWPRLRPRWVRVARVAVLDQHAVNDARAIDEMAKPARPYAVVASTA